MIEKSNIAGPTGRVDGCRVLIVEDEYFVAQDLEQELKSIGATIVGPIADLSGAKDQISRNGFDVAIIDINLDGELAFPLADELMRQRIPFVFATGYGADIIPARFRGVMRWEKPFEMSKAITDMARLCGQCR